MKAELTKKTTKKETTQCNAHRLTVLHPLDTLFSFFLGHRWDRQIRQSMKTLASGADA
jgi:hypothetical protein